MAAADSTADVLYQKMKENGICHICCKRYLYKVDSNEIINKKWFEEDKISSDGDKIKLKKSNPCIICLDVFSDSVEEVVEKLIQSSEATSYDSDSFIIALILPSTCQSREQKVYAYLKKEFPLLLYENAITPRLGIKEAWKHRVCPSISKVINKTLDLKSELIIQITLVCEDDENANNKKTKKFNSIQTEKMKSELEDSEKLNVFSLSVPSHQAYCKAVSVRRESIFVAGRYNKFSRTLSQTPWILSDGERKTDTSVEEIISTNIKKITKSSDSRFSSSGREDIDVRMLGNGRPFAVELINARISKIPPSVIMSIESEINAIDPDSVFVRDLQIVDRTEMVHLKSGEESKTKDYCAVCFVETRDNYENLVKKLPSEPFTIQQKTPLRVLHRRTVATREKTIYSLNAQLLNIDYRDDGILMKINLKTQAGTYVKEFMHGDFGRTLPSLSVMFDEAPVDVLALDVTNVEIDWPTPVNYDKS
ncbi:tRNA pseudouridine synthase Pus10 isoform X2 [Planococcus citri]|uniref:tRNA pseudouridine synthase Pus10 isoform X2 n=1 Tax=Planococcus citri TaxID=170843 RepID=UPI0031F9C610